MGCRVAHAEKAQLQVIGHQGPPKSRRRQIIGILPFPSHDDCADAAIDNSTEITIADCIAGPGDADDPPVSAHRAGGAFRSYFPGFLYQKSCRTAFILRC
jgi:hypothetical protein